MNTDIVTDYQIQPTFGTTRDGFGEGLREVGSNSQVVALCADLTESVRMHWFKETYPERYIAMGVAEENMVGVAAGLALRGKIPVAGSYAVFNPGNTLGPLRASVCYSNLPVKIIGGHAGITTGEDGATHQALEDIAIMRTLPNMTVVVPCDKEEARKAIQALVDDPGPGYLRIGKYKTLNLTNKATPFEIGTALTFREGKDLTIIATGNMVAQALDSADMLAIHGISTRVINMHTIKPIDTAAIITAARKTGAIVTAEEHQIHGGLGSAVAEVVTEHYPVPMAFVGTKDTFGESGPARKLLAKYKLDPQQIVKKSLDVLQKKKVSAYE